MPFQVKQQQLESSVRNPFRIPSPSPSAALPERPGGEPVIAGPVNVRLLGPLCRAAARIQRRDSSTIAADDFPALTESKEHEANLVRREDLLRPGALNELDLQG